MSITNHFNLWPINYNKYHLGRLVLQLIWICIPITILIFELIIFNAKMTINFDDRYHFFAIHTPPKITTSLFLQSITHQKLLLQYNAILFRSELRLFRWFLHLGTKCVSNECGTGGHLLPTKLMNCRFSPKRHFIPKWIQLAKQSERS